MMNMTRRNFFIWFAIFTLLQWPYAFSFYSIIDLLLSMIIVAVLLSNILGVVFVGYIYYSIMPQIWLYLFDKQQWLLQYSREIGYPNFSFDDIFWLHEVLPLVLALAVVLHLYFCYKRCKVIGLSPWWILVPLYNPFVLLYRKSNQKMH